MESRPCGRPGKKLHKRRQALGVFPLGGADCLHLELVQLDRQVRWTIGVMREDRESNNTES